ncbi:MAG: aminoglycoside phosphotransferase family protein [Actinobacteria bacterium]|nr:aminoglycoside phosphotransferase family protein [Actinomycetota bacterium]
MAVTVIDVIGEMTPAWLDDALGLSGPEAVTSADAAPLGTGQMSDSYRVLVTHSDGSVTRLIAKLAATDPTSRATGLMLRAYEKEVRFYQELAPTLGIRTPRVYAAEIDTATGSFVLLLEDLAPAAAGDQLTGCTPRQAHAALAELVELHAPRWGDPTLRDVEWLLGDRGPARDMMIGLLPGLWDGFRERYSERVGDDVRRAGDLVFARLAAFYRDREPATIVHGDYRLDNLLFDPGNGSVAVLDWQTCTVGPGPADAAYFVGAGLLPEVRRVEEAGLFDHYHRGLVAAGVDVTRDECWEAYRRGTWAGLVMAVGASMLVERTERGDDMFMAMASRHACHALDLDAADLLDS